MFNLHPHYLHIPAIPFENSGCTDSSLKPSSKNHLSLTQPILSIIPESIKGLDVVKPLTRWHHNHWFFDDRKNLSAKQRRDFYKIMQAVEHVKIYSGHVEPKYRDYDEDCMTYYQLDVKNMLINHVLTF